MLILSDFKRTKFVSFKVYQIFLSDWANEQLSPQRCQQRMILIESIWLKISILYIHLTYLSPPEIPTKNDLVWFKIIILNSYFKYLLLLFI